MFTLLVSGNRITWSIKSYVHTAPQNSACLCSCLMNFFNGKESRTQWTSAHLLLLSFVARNINLSVNIERKLLLGKREGQESGLWSKIHCFPVNPCVPDLGMHHSKPSSILWGARNSLVAQGGQEGEKSKTVLLDSPKMVCVEEIPLQVWHLLSSFSSVLASFYLFLFFLSYFNKLGGEKSGLAGWSVTIATQSLL